MTMSNSSPPPTEEENIPVITLNDDEADSHISTLQEKAYNSETPKMKVNPSPSEREFKTPTPYHHYKVLSSVKN